MAAWFSWPTVFLMELVISSMKNSGKLFGVRGLATMFQGKLLAAEILAEVPWQALIMITHQS